MVFTVSRDFLTVSLFLLFRGKFLLKFFFFFYLEVILFVVHQLYLKEKQTKMAFIYSHIST